VESADLINHAMPKYVAQRALSMIGEDISNPKVLILGVAYKPGVGDVRETPVAELRNHLSALGAIVAWHDPLVPIWEGLEPVDLEWTCDIAILATKQPGMAINQLLARGTQVLDCTNSFGGTAGVTLL
jgi:UDP-N-acetyl-D-glucosamine dehydrogenase